MDVTAIPFVEKVGICRTEEGTLTLPFSTSTQNHLNTIHASAQFALAETASGEALQRLFPELAGKVVPVLRESHVKFKRPASSAIFAFPAVSEEAVSKFKEQFEKKRRSSITVDVEVRDSDGVVTSVGMFDWFVQGLPQGKT
ncbi:PaaI family thioesterase [Methylocaldum gracile]|uniref:PaaI family thioesterase n=1 Tax=unclassified Methylocaldum TaxID=2622260 RepID=UPI0014150945